MPINAPIEYYKAEEKFRRAKSREEKIVCLEDMLRYLPSHKGTENLRAQLRRKLARLKSEKPKKIGRRCPFIIKKEGSARVCIVGVTNSGKSTLLNALTGVDVEIANYPYTTRQPRVGMMKYCDVCIQVVEIPSTFEPWHMNVLSTTDLILVVLDGEKNLELQKRKLNNILERAHINVRRLYVITKTERINLEKLKKDIWKNLGIIRVYTKSPGKPPDAKPIILKEGSTVKDVAKEIHKSLVKHFRFARVFGPSVRFDGTKVGLDHVLFDGDVVEIRA